MANKILYRSCTNRIIGGVAGGLGEYFDIDPVLVRLVFVLLAFAGAGFLLYIIAWLIIPSDPTCAEKHEEAKEEIRDKIHEVAEEARERTRVYHEPRGNGRMIIGLILIALGAIFLIQTVANIDLWHNFWPIIVILVGIGFLAGSTRR